MMNPNAATPADLAFADDVFEVVAAIVWDAYAMGKTGADVITLANLHKEAVNTLALVILKAAEAKKAEDIACN